jgi:hypothetical protein
MKNARLAVLLIGHFLSTVVCFAQDGAKKQFESAVIGGVGGFGGTTQRNSYAWTGGTWAADTRTFAYSIGYRQQLRGVLSASVSYVNQGHYDRRSDHHSRDDFQFELFLDKRPSAGPVEFRIGGGGAYYSETDRTRGNTSDFQNWQGFGLVASAVVDVDISDRLFVEGRVHRHFVFERYDSTNVLLGMGFRLRNTGRTDDRLAQPSKHAIRIQYGRGILNSNHSEALPDAFQLAYESRLSKRFAASVSYLHEGSAPQLRRKGVALQGEVRQPLGDAVTLGGGLGPYINVDQSDFFERKGKVSTDALLTVFIDFRVTRHVDLSVSAMRPRSLFTLKNKPMTDVLLGGLRLRF